MLLPIIPSNNLPLLLKFDVLYRDPIDLNIIGFDADKKTVFFNRLANPGAPGIYPLEFPMPITPKNLRISFLDETNKSPDSFEVVALKCDFLPQRPTALFREDLDFIEFLKWFSVNAGRLPVGMYKSSNGKHRINYVEDIITGENEYTSKGEYIPPGIKLNTPARTDHENGEIQMARSQVKNFTVPIIMVIGMHERTHFIHNTMDETFCDLEALRICLGLGFPKTECIYAFTNIFEDTQENINRINASLNFIDNFKYAA